MFGLDTTLTVFLIICIVAAMAFEFINGFHDTANAVATVIYTHSLKPQTAVIWSGIWNFIGVYVGGIAVAMGIVNLLPLNLLIDQNVYHSIAMILSLIITAIIWNLGTWWFGIPCSSSHTLIGSIFGVGLAYTFLPEATQVALNWSKVKDVGLSLMVSPLVGFGIALGFMYLLKYLIKDKSIFKEPDHHNPPPFFIRLILILTCTTVSFSHGSNDGQKGVGLMMIILIGIIPFNFAINTAENPLLLKENTNKIELVLSQIPESKMDDEAKFNVSQIKKNMDTIQFAIGSAKNFKELPSKKLLLIRKSILTSSKKIEELTKESNCLSHSQEKQIESHFNTIKAFTEYAPKWVILLISISLGLGTMVGWKKIVITLGEKIGKTPLSYAQGVVAQTTATITIGFSSMFGLPVSTTHVLSSGIAGTMVAKKKKNLKMKTVRNIAIAWVVTLPVTIVLSAGLFLLLRYFLK